MINEMHNLEGKAIHLCISEGKSNKKKADDRNRICCLLHYLSGENRKKQNISMHLEGTVLDTSLWYRLRIHQVFQYEKCALVINRLIPSDIMCLI